MLISKRSLKFFALALALAYLGRSRLDAQTTVTWTGGGGSANSVWHVPANWNLGVVPNNGTPTPLYNVVINSTNGGTNYFPTITSTTGNVTITSLNISAPQATLVVSSAGNLQVTGAATISQGNIQMVSATLKGGTWTLGPSSSLNTASTLSNTLDGVHFTGAILNLSSNGHFVIRNGTTFGVGSTMILANATFSVSQTVPVDNLAISAGGTNSFISCSNATFGSGMSVTYGSSLNNFISGTGLANNGIIQTDVSGVALTFQVTNLTNNGLISANSNSAVTLSTSGATTFTNSWHIASCWDRFFLGPE